MGNSVSVSAYANQCFGTFIQSFVNSISKSDSAQSKLFLKKATYQFATYVEDLLVNDKQVQQFDDADKVRFVGALYGFFCSMPVDKMLSGEDAFAEATKLRFVGPVINSFADGTSANDLVERFLAATFLWNGTSFVQWDGETWSLCSDEDVCADGFLDNAGLNVPLHTAGLDSELVRAGIAAFDAYRQELTVAAARLGVSENFTAFVEKLKEQSERFDAPSATIPCHSVIVDLSNGESQQRDYQASDLVTVRLSYDPVIELTAPVKKFLSRSTNSKGPIDLGTTLVSCGISAGRCLTVISGPKGSGKSTILGLIHALFGPLVCSQAVYNYDNTDQIRTCLVDENSFPSEEFVRNHSCDHLVVTCESSELSGIFAGRKIRTLTLKETIPQEKVWVDCLKSLSTRTQLGSLLAWALRNCDTLVEHQSQDNMDPLSMFMGKVGGGRDCPDRSARPPAADAGDTPSGGDSEPCLMRMGPNGPERVSMRDLFEAMSGGGNEDEEQESNESTVHRGPSISVNQREVLAAAQREKLRRTTKDD